jgi:hypothetical protein
MEMRFELWNVRRLYILERNAYRLLVGKPEGKRPLGRPRVGGWILGWILERWDGMMWTGLVWLRIGTGRELL